MMLNPCLLEARSDTPSDKNDLTVLHIQSLGLSVSTPVKQSLRVRRVSLKVTSHKGWTHLTRIHSPLAFAKTRLSSFLVSLSLYIKYLKHESSELQTSSLCLHKASERKQLVEQVAGTHLSQKHGNSVLMDPSGSTFKVEHKYKLFAVYKHNITALPHIIQRRNICLLSYPVWVLWLQWEQRTRLSQHKPGIEVTTRCSYSYTDIQDF